jgi:RNA polymerase subunit RPABC4/transcription elongation factor Spt4
VSRKFGSFPRTGEAAHASRNWVEPAFAALVVLLVVLGSVVAFGANTPGAQGTPATPAIIQAAPPTHGDLVVGSGQTYTIQPTSGTPFYYQGGNITVLAGGTLEVRNVTLSFVQFVANNGTLASRLSHIYTFSDAGTVNLYNSTVTTDMVLINAYAKLTMVVTGTMTLWNSAFEFPGWLTVSGSSADLTLNNSLVAANPAVGSVVEPLPILADTEYAPSLLVTGGAQLNLFHSIYTDTYANNPTVTGIPGPAPLTASNFTVTHTGTNLTNLSTPTDSANLTLDWLYSPVGLAGGDLVLFYNHTGPNSTSTVQIWYEGIGYVVGPVKFLNGTLNGIVTLPLPVALISAINAAGLLTYLDNTGDFGLPSAFALNFSAPTGPDVTVSQATVSLLPSLQYNMVANGTGTKVSAVDATLGLTFQPVPASPLSVVAPFPWDSNKFLFTNGATGYLANLSVNGSLPYNFAQSAILTNGSSAVYLYRWAQLNVTNTTSPGFTEVVGGASVSAYYAYDDNQTNNATASTLNDIQTTNPAMWGYLQYWDLDHGVLSYGTSNATGQASLLLASSQLDNPNLPDGVYLGDYNVGFRVPYVNNTTWDSVSVSAYPLGVASGTFGFASPDVTRVTVAVAPPEVRFLAFTVPSSPLDLNNQYASSGTIFVDGPGFASIVLTATPVGGGTPVVIATTNTVTNGTFLFEWNSLQGSLSAGTTYVITATAAYKTASTVYDFPGTYSVPATTSPAGFLSQTILGLPLWLWLAIAVAVIVAIVVVMLIFRRQAAGKLVECGECGELIPEDATACPKCGAEFESDLVRCSRCSSTIPADSQFCPECSAQLLGKPGEGDSDPERQAYADFTEKFRADGKKELGDNYTESSFWDWWKRQPTYVPFSQWKVQQNKGTPRPGMSQPPVGSEVAADAPLPPGRSPPPGGAGAAGTGAAPAPGAGPGFTAPPSAAVAPASASSGSLKPCPNCGKEIPPEYLVCPFCGAVTQ